MTASVNQLTAAAVFTNPYEIFLISLSAIVLLVLLLLQRELVRASDAPFYIKWIGALDIAIVPLLFVFAITIVSRFIALL